MNNRFLIFIALLLALFLSSCGPAPRHVTDFIYESVEYISFDDLAPPGYRLMQSWDAMGMDDAENVYIGFTSLRPDGKEDFAIFRYHHATGERAFIDTFMEASLRAGNLHADEEIPKGHTNFIHVDGILYMASQGFHDFKRALDGSEGEPALEDFRGAHLYALDSRTGELSDLSADLPGGVLLPHEGIIALNHMPSTGQLIGLTHPHGSLIFWDMERGAVTRIAAGIAWQPGLVVSRDFVVDDDNQQIYMYRGPENTTWKEADDIYLQYDRNDAFPVYVYDYQSDTITESDSTVTGGMWGSAIVLDTQAYVSSAAGHLIEIDFRTGAARVLAQLMPEEYAGEFELSFLYILSLSPDQKTIYSIPTYASSDAGNFGGLYEYDIATGQSENVLSLPSRVYTGADIKDRAGNLYFAAFGDHGWNDNCTLMVIGSE